MIRALACVLLLAAGPAWAATPVAPDSLAQRLQQLMDRHELVAAGSLAREAVPRLLASPPSQDDARRLDLFDVVLEAQARGLRTTSPEAESLAARAVARRRALPDSLALAHTLLQSARLLASRAVPRLARTQFEEGLRLTIAHAPRDSSALDDFDLALGSVCLPLVDTRGAERYYRAALELEERRFGPDHPASARAWLGLGITTAFLTDPAVGRTKLEHALELVLRQTPPDPATFTMILNNLTRACTRAGEWTQARAYGERAVVATDSLYGPDHQVTARALTSLADVLAALGDRTEALRHARRAVAIWRGVVHGPNLEFATAMGVLGEIFYDSNVLDSAAVYLERKEAMYSLLLGPDHPAVLHARGRIAVVESERGHPARALALLASLPRDTTADAGVWSPEMNRALAQVHRSLGHRVVAESLYREVAAAHGRLEGPRSPFTLGFRNQHAQCLFENGDHDAAFAEAREVQQLSREVLTDAAARLSDREALAFQEEIANGTGLLLTLAADPHGLAPADRLAAWDALSRDRLAVLEARAERRRAPRAGSGAEAGLRAALAAASDSLARLAAIELASEHADAALGERIAQARRAREAAERALGESDAAYRDARARRMAGVGDAIAALPPGAALVGFVRFDQRHAPVPADSGMGHVVESRYAAFVHAPGRADVAFVPLGASGPLDELLGRWIERSAHPIPAADTTSWRRFRALGTRVRERVWDPVRAKLGAADRVFVVPDGLLADVNLLALPTGRDAWLAESGPALDVLATERDLVREADPGPVGHGLLALGDPAFGSSPAEPQGPGTLVALAGAEVHSVLRDADSLSLPGLPASADEVRMLDDFWRRLDGSRGDVVSLTGANASEEAFRTLAPGRSVLHLATHAVSLAGREVRLEPGARGVGGVRANRPGDAVESRSDLAALALAGAGRRDTTSARDDGWLTSEEVLSLDLSGVDWAVLSACETGVTDPRAGESIQGLVRAFRLAGVHTVIASLWQVDDRSTRDWMVRAYRAHWQDGLPTADAVRAACREALAARRARGLSLHPFYWGAFVASGPDR